MMAGWNDCAIADALQALAQAIRNPNRGEAAGAIEYQGLGCFERNNPPAFNRGYNPDSAQNWIRDRKRIGGRGAVVHTQVERANERREYCYRIQDFTIFIQLKQYERCDNL